MARDFFNSKIFRLGLAALAVILFVMFILNNLGPFLVVSTPLKKSDAIIVLGGEREERVIRAAELYNKGYAKNVILSGGTVVTGYTYARLMSAQIQDLGVPKRALILEDKAESTYENAVFTKRIMEGMGFRSAIVVSSPYHMRRAKMIFGRVFRGSGISLCYHHPFDPDYINGNWWNVEQKRKYVFSEYVKLVYYLRYLFIGSRNF